jgi:hypothetical protein
VAGDAPWAAAWIVVSDVRIALRESGGKRVHDEVSVQANLLRDIIGNPFRPAAVNPVWRTPTAVQLAQAIYEARDFAALPLLADALEEAGCDDAGVLAHCRQGGEHARGCFAVDAVLGRK